MRCWRWVAACCSAWALQACGGDPCAAGKSVFTGQWAPGCVQGATGGTGGAGGGATAPVVRYDVSGTATSATILYDTVGASSTETRAPLPWSYSFAGTDGLALSLWALNTSDSGTLDVTISIDGAPVARNSARGAAASVEVEFPCC
jgi:hypothetical protein